MPVSVSVSVYAAAVDESEARVGDVKSSISTNVLRRRWRGQQVEALAWEAHERRPVLRRDLEKHGERVKVTRTP